MLNTCRKVFLGAALATLVLAGSAHAAELTENAVLASSGPGVDFALAGTGLKGIGAGTISMQIDGPIMAAYLYWGGRGEPLSNMFRFDGSLYPGDAIGSEGTPQHSPAYAFRADVTAHVNAIFSPPGELMVDVEDPASTATTLNGASLLVIYQDESDPACWSMQVYEGSDYTYHPNFPDPAGYIDPVTFMYDAYADPRVADLGLVVGDAEPVRPDRIEISNNADVLNLMDGSDGDEWDSPILSIHVPAGANSTTVELISPVEEGAFADSLHWIVASLRVSCPQSWPEESCCEEGKLIELAVQYTGDGCDATSHAQDPGKVKCEGDPAGEAVVHIIANDKDEPHHHKAKIWFDGLVSLGEVFNVTAAHAGESKFKGDMRIHILSADDEVLQSVKFHVSCSQPLETGDQFGASLIVGCVGDDVPVEGDCCEYGRPAGLTLTYTGDDCSATNHSQDPKKVKCEGDPDDAPLVHIIATDKKKPDDHKAKIWFEGDVALGEAFEISAANAGAHELKAKTFLFIYDIDTGDRLQKIEFHTSCSQPLVEGDQFGSILLNGCVAEEDPEDPEGDLCADGAKPRIVTMRYTGENCDATHHSQDPSKVTCEGDPAGAPIVRILATDKENPDDPRAKVWFDDMVLLTLDFDIDAAAAGESKLKARTWVHLYDLNGDLLQTIQFHTSCSQPLILGDQFGSLRLVDFVAE